MIFAGGHLGFFRIRHLGIFKSGLVRFFDLENIDVDTKIRILCQLELEILSKLDFHVGTKYGFRPFFQNGRNPYFVPIPSMSEIRNT